MPAKDLFHDACVRALQKDGWTITNDPLSLKVGDVDLFVDLGAERLVTAEKGTERIAVEIKSFLNRSGTHDIERAVGQYVVYQDALALSPQNSDRVLFLALRESSYLALFETSLGKMLLDNQRLRLIVFDLETETITRWIA